MAGTVPCITENHRTHIRAGESRPTTEGRSGNTYILLQMSANAAQGQLQGGHWLAHRLITWPCSTRKHQRMAEISCTTDSNVQKSPSHMVWTFNFLGYLESNFARKPATVKPREGTMNNFVPSRNRWNQDYLASAFHHWLDEQTLRNMSKKLESSWKHWSSDAGHDIGRTAGQVKTVRTVQAGQMWMRKTMSVLSGWPLTAQIWLHNLVRAENFMPVVLYAAKTYFKLCPF